MIQVKLKVQISDGEAPYDYVWSSDDQDVSFEPATGSTDGLVFVTISYPDEATIGTATITLSGEDDNGCNFSDTVTVPNSCDSLTLNSISANASTLTFTVAGSNPNCATVNFAWTYDTVLFNKISEVNVNNTSSITLALKSPDILPNTSTVTVKATDCNSCTKTQNVNFSICKPQAEPLTVNLYYNTATGQYESAPITIADPTGCSGYTYDWTTFLGSFPFTQYGTISASNNKFIFTQTGTTTEGTYGGVYTVKATNGVKSKAGAITAILHKPDVDQPIIIADRVINLDCAAVAGTTIDIVIEDSTFFVDAGSTVDWNTFQLVYPPTPLSPSITIALNAQNKRVIRYRIPTPIKNDAFSWTVCTTEGNCARSAVYSILECAQAPTANNDTATVACGSSVLVDILQNDLGNGSPLNASTVIFTQAPTKGTVIMSAGKAQYTANAGVTGSDTFKYKVRNGSNKESNEATVTVTIVCAGSNVNVSLCN